MLSKLMPAVTAAAGGVVLALWLATSPVAHIDARVPGKDRAPGTASVETVPAKLTGTLTPSTGTPADLPGTWPRFRGPRFDNVSHDPTPLARSWPEGGPPKLWSIDVGEGHAGAAVLGGRVYVLDYDRAKKADALRCLSLADGKEIWRFAYPVKVKRNHGMSRTVPAATDQHVVALGPKCHVTCLDAKSGKMRWMLDLVREFGATVPPWYAGQCPLIDGDRVILAPGGPDALLVAVDVATGKPVWTTPNPDGWKMTHTSVMPMMLDGQRTLVYVASGGVVGVAADDGRVLWKTPDWRIRIAACPSPVPVGGGRLFLTGGYNAGSAMFQIEKGETALVAREVFRLKAKVLDSPQHSPILYQGHLYAVRADGQLACMALDGTVKWTSGQKERFGLGPYLIANGLVFVMDDKAVLTLAEATPIGYKKLAQAKILDGAHDAWGPMALAAGRLIVRDLTRMVCLDVGAK